MLFRLERQSKRFMYKGVLRNPPAEAGMCTINWHLYIPEVLRAKTMIASHFSSRISSSILTLMCIVHNALGAHLSSPSQATKHAKSSTTITAKAVTKIPIGSPVAYNASCLIAAVRSIMPSTTSEPVVNASIVKPKNLVLNDQKCATNALLLLLIH